MSSESHNTDSTDSESAPSPMDTDDGGDDDEPPAPPAAGAVQVESRPGPSASLAPRAEPNHVVAPTNAPSVA